MNTARFEEILQIGGKTNSLGKADEVIAQVLKDKALMSELYSCMSSEDAWVRMRAADAFEKVCREHPEWIEPYTDRMQKELSGPEQQPSIQWHLAQIYTQVSLTDGQKQRALSWLAELLESNQTDWIVSANAMQALAYFVAKGDFEKQELLRLLKIQRTHRSNSVVKKADKIIASLGR